MKTEKKLTFGRIFWPTFWSALIVSILGLIIWLIVISGIISSFETESGLMVKDKTILHMELNGPISDKANSEFDPMSFSIGARIRMYLAVSLKYVKDPMFLNIVNIYGLATSHKFLSLCKRKTKNYVLTRNLVQIYNIFFLFSIFI